MLPQLPFWQQVNQDAAGTPHNFMGAAVQALPVHLCIQPDMRWLNRCTTLAGWRAARCLTHRGSASRCPSRYNW
jgi:hypothetical protein